MLIYKLSGITLLSIALLSLLWGAVIFRFPGILSRLLRKKVVLSQRNILLIATSLFAVSLPLGGTCAVLYKKPNDPFVFIFLTFFFLLFAVLIFLFGIVSLIFPQFLSWFLRKATQISRWKILFMMLLLIANSLFFTGLCAWLGKNF